MGNSATTGAYRVEVLGPLTVFSHGEEIGLGGPKRRPLLALRVADIGNHAISPVLKDAV